MHLWQLPEYVADILPQQGWVLERQRRELLDMFWRHGYDMVSPPLVEFSEALMLQHDEALERRTFKMLDQLSGRTLGLRADMTPQVARIDAHLLNQTGVTRLCYAAPVVHALPEGLLGTREPLMLGAEIYGAAGLEADLEIIQLMLQAIAKLEWPSIKLDLGHIGIYRAMAQAAALSEALDATVFSALQNKDIPTLQQVSAALPAPWNQAFVTLARCHGRPHALDEWAAALPALPEIEAALGHLAQLAEILTDRGVKVCVDLAELRAGHYHSGLVFAVYAEGWPNTVARGGRYDGVCAHFGRARPATGFSLDLRQSQRLSRGVPPSAGIAAPYRPEDADLAAVIAQLRDQGERVVQDMTETAATDACAQVLVQTEQGWVVQARLPT